MRNIDRDHFIDGDGGEQVADEVHVA
jgi:hypothetical protein